MEQLQENGAVQEFLRLLMGMRPDMGQEYSMLLWQMEGMARQLEAALTELQEVKAQLAAVQEDRALQPAITLSETMESRLLTARERFQDMGNRIVDHAKEAVAKFKRAGIPALDKAASKLGIKSMLEDFRNDMAESIAGMRKSIEKVEAVGSELRSVGGHIKNAGRAIAGKERQDVDGGKEGRFQAAVLAPMRTEEKILRRLDNMALMALGNVVRLEQAAERGRREKEPGQGKNSRLSILKDLEETKAQATAIPAALPDKSRKVEAAL